MTTLSNLSVVENTSNGTVVATVSGGTAPYTLTNDAGGAFTLVDNGGTWELRVANTVLIDYEASGLHTMAVEITDDASVATTHTLNVTDVANESVTGTAGADEINGGDGDDTLSGGDGNDLIDGGDGNNSMLGGAGADTITGGAGDDYIDGGSGIDRMIGGDGNDTYVVDLHDDVVVGALGGGVDRLILSDGSITDINNVYEVAVGIEDIAIASAAGVAYIEANGASNTIYGNNSANYIDTNLGVDTVYGGDGDDTYVVHNSATEIHELKDNGAGVFNVVASGTDLVMASDDYTLVDNNIENLTLIGTNGISGTGNANDNVITGNAFGNRLDGGAGTDTLAGGNGNDTYVMHVGDADVISETTTGGSADLVEIAGDFNLGLQAANVEHLTNTDTGVGHQLVGSDGNNRITGNSGDDEIVGGLGKDTMIGGDGNDTYYVDQADDVVTEIDGLTEGVDRVVASVSYDLSLRAAEVEDLELDTAAADVNINATGNDYDNVLMGNQGNNRLDGKLGQDTLLGGDGDDTYVVRDAATVVGEFKDNGFGVFSVASAGTDTVEAHVSYTLSDANLENLVLEGSDDIDGTGNAAANVITGNSGANAIDGGAGADTMDGGSGDDTYTVDNVGDVVTEASSAGGYDVVNSSVSITIGANIDELNLIGAAALNGTGNASANLIVGNAEDNVLDGAAGADTMWGGDGNDTYHVDNAGDVALDVDTDGTTPTAGTDWVLTETQDIDLSDAARFSGIDNVNLGSGTLNLDATGTSGDNEIVGNQGNNRLDAGTGADTLTGGLGNDVYVLDGLDDTVIENADEGEDTIEVNADYSIAAMVGIDNLTLTGSSDIDATGNSGDNKITGNSGANEIDGGAGADRMEGGAGDDTYVVDDNADRVIEDVAGGFDYVSASASFTLGLNVEGLQLTGTDDINGAGNDSDNYIIGNSGANIINGGDGADTMEGGDGDDTFWVNEVGDVVDGGNDTDVVKSGAISLDLGDYTDVENAAISGSGAFNLTGTAGDNELTGGGGANRIDGNGGADTMYGGGGDDTYVVDSADDVAEEAGNGVIAGGNDTVEWTGGVGFTSYTLGDKIENLEMLGAAVSGTGNALANTITGNALDNVIDGGTGRDTMIGGAGDDTYYVDHFQDTITDTAGTADTAISTARSWTMSDGVENGVIADGGLRRDMFGNDLDNEITGGDQANWIKGGLGADTLSGGAGNDTFVVDATDEVDGGDGIDWVYSNDVDVDLSNYTDVENINLTNVSSTVFNAIDATGNALDNRILGNDAANYIDGGDGDDTMQGAKGDDTYVVTSSTDRVLEWKNQGTDTVEATGGAGFTAYTLRSNVENLELGAGMITGKGNGLSNEITGNAADNVLNGAGGLDTMIGGDGNDTYYINRTDEVLTELVGEGTDTVISYVSNYTLGANLENLTLMGLNRNGTGNELANTLTGNNAANLLDGGFNTAGVDTMVGGRGNDTYVVNHSGDVVTELNGGGYDRVQSSVSYTLSDFVEVLELTGSADINGTGNSGANQLLGNAGDNTLNGGAGNDILDGGAGIDTLIGGAGNDVFRLKDSGDSDVIQDFVVADDTVQLSKAAFAALGAVGTIDATAFAIGASAGDANDRIIYNSANGKLFYDADGSGGGAQVEIAQMTGGLALTNADFVIIS